MLSSAVLTATGLQQLEQSVRGSDIKDIVTVRGTYEAQLTKIDLHGLWMQRLRKALPGITYNAIHAGRVPIIFPADMNQQPMLSSGLVAHPGEIICYAAGTEHHLKTPVGWQSATILLTLKDFAEYGRALLGHEPPAPTEARVVRPSAASMARLMNLHKAASDLALTP